MSNELLREALESALCAPDWSASLTHVHEAIAHLSTTGNSEQATAVTEAILECKAECATAVEAMRRKTLEECDERVASLLIEKAAKFGTSHMQTAYDNGVNDSRAAITALIDTPENPHAD